MQNETPDDLRHRRDDEEELGQSQGSDAAEGDDGASVDAVLERARREIRDLVRRARDAGERATRALADSMTQERPSASRELRLATAALDAASSQSEILSRLLEECSRFAGRSAVLLQRDDSAGLSVWNASGFDDASPGDLEGTELSTPESWRPALDGDATLRLRDLGASPFEALGASRPRESLLVPLVLRDRVPALLYADREDQRQPFDPDAVQLLAHLCCQALETVSLRSERPSATLTEPEFAAADGGAPAAAPSVAEPREEAEPAADLARAEAREDADREDEDSSSPQEALEEAADGPSITAPEILEPSSEEAVVTESEAAPAEPDEPQADTDTASTSWAPDPWDQPAETAPEEPDHGLSASDLWEDVEALAEPSTADLATTAAQDSSAPGELRDEADESELDPAPLDPASAAPEDLDAAPGDDAPATPHLEPETDDLPPIPPPPAPRAPTERDEPVAAVEHDWLAEPEAELSESSRDDVAGTLEGEPEGASATPAFVMEEEAEDLVVPEPPETSSEDEDTLAFSPPEPPSADEAASPPEDTAAEEPASADPPARVDRGTPPMRDAAAPPAPAAFESLQPRSQRAPSAFEELRAAQTRRRARPADEEIEASPPPEPPPAAPPSTAAGQAAGESSASGQTTEVRPPADVDGPGLAFQPPGRSAADDDLQHDEAKRLARLLVSEIKLYNEEEIEIGRQRGSIYSQLREHIDRSRRMYDQRVDASVRESTDYFREELVNSLADGDRSLLGI